MHAAEKRGPAHKSSTHRLLRDYKQAEGWNVLALSNGRWKLPDGRFGAFLEQYVSDLPRYKLGLVVKKSEYFPCIMDVDKSATKGASVSSPMEVLKMVVRALFGISFWGSQRFALRRSGGLEKLQDAVRTPELCELPRAVPGHHSGEQHGSAHPGEAVGDAGLGAPRGRVERHRGREGADLERPAPAGISEVQGSLWPEGQDQEYKEVEADIAGGCYVPCQIDFVGGHVVDEAITYEALSARSAAQTGAERGRAT